MPQWIMDIILYSATDEENLTTVSPFADVAYTGTINDWKEIVLNLCNYIT